MNHYVGQEKLAPLAPWTTLAFALDWGKPPRLQQTPTWHYVNTDQWRYEGGLHRLRPRCRRSATLGQGPRRWTSRRRRCAWAGCPSTRSSTATRWRSWREARGRRSRGPTASIARAGSSTSSSPTELRFSVDDPDAPENWPRVWFIWRGNAIMSSAKGHEFFLNHYLGTHDNVVAAEAAQGQGQDGASDGAGAAREDGPGGRHQLPHGHLGALLRHRPADGHLVREERPQHHRPALLHPPARGGGAAVWESKSGLGDLQGDRQEGERAGAAGLPGAGAGPRLRAAAARHARRDRPARGPRLARGRVRADARQDDAALCAWSSATTPTSTTSSSRSARASARTGISGNGVHMPIERCTTSC